MQENKVENKKLKVLIVEDEDATRLFLSTLVKIFDKLVVRDFEKVALYAKNGLEAVEICKNNADINLILMDIKMPQLDGYEATAQIREFNKDVVIIAQTAFNQPGDREKAIRVGCNDFITKPIKIDELISIIGKYIDLR